MPPPKPNPNWGGGSAPLSFFPSSPSFPLLVGLGKGGNLLLVGLGIPPWGRTMRLVGPLLPSFIYGGGEHPIDTQVDS